MPNPLTETAFVLPIGDGGGIKVPRWLLLGGGAALIVILLVKKQQGAALTGETSEETEEEDTAGGIGDWIDQLAAEMNLPQPSDAGLTAEALGESDYYIDTTPYQDTPPDQWTPQPVVSNVSQALTTIAIGSKYGRPEPVPGGIAIGSKYGLAETATVSSIPATPTPTAPSAAKVVVEPLRSRVTATSVPKTVAPAPVKIPKGAV